MDESSTPKEASGGQSPPAPGMSWLLPTGLSGDPLLKRLVELAGLGWTARLVMISNGVVIEGTLISPSVFREALAAGIAHRTDDPSYQTLDGMVASAITADDPEPFGIEPSEQPEPRFIHLTDVRIGTDVELSFLRLRLPAVSGFWLVEQPVVREG